MYATLIRHSQDVTKSLLKLLPKDLPPALKPKPGGSLYEILSRTPNVEGMEVHQRRWSEKQVPNSYWKVTHARFKCEGKHGKAWGILYWRGMLSGDFRSPVRWELTRCGRTGKRISRNPEVIRGGLKYSWREGRSQAIQPAPRPKPTTAVCLPFRVTTFKFLTCCSSNITIA